MSFPAYPAYKDSTISWLGRVPSDWSIAPIKAIASCNDEVLSESTDDESVIEYVEISGVEEGRGITETETLAFGKAPSRARRVVRHGDVLLSTVRTYLRAIATISNPPENLVASTGFAVIRPRGVHPGFLGYLLHAEYFMSEVIARSVGISYPAINASELMRLKAPIPSLHEQRAIAAFLDRETAKIDALVEEQKRLIELLKEKRQAVISQAVTKGLDQSVPMKDSGVECLGEVPAHWQVRPLKKCIAFQEGPGIMAADFQDDGVPLLRISCVQSEAVTLAGCNYLDPDKVARQWSHFRVEIGDLLISGSASMGVVSEVGEEAEGAVPYTGLMRLQSRHGGMLKDFIKHLVVSDSFMRQVQLLKTGSTIQHFGPTHLNQMLVVLPPEDEQEAIATFLTSENRRMDSLRAEAEAGMALLEERRSALISAAVTGKIDVRGLVPRPEVISA